MKTLTEELAAAWAVTPRVRGAEQAAPRFTV